MPTSFGSIPTALVTALAFHAVVAAQEPAIVDDAQPRLRWEQKEGDYIALLRGEQTLWRFEYGAAQPKPYFHPLALPGGPVLTWDRPADHVWHHGLWFCWKFINGVNYWENDSSGRPPGRTTWSDVEIVAGDDHVARIRLLLVYHPGDGKAVLREERAIEVFPPDDEGCIRIDWSGAFHAVADEVKLDRTPLPHEPGGKTWGGYSGLSLRMIDLKERQLVTADGPVAFTKDDRYRGKSAVVDYSGTIDGVTAGIAISDFPRNLNAPTPWYAIASTPMTFFSPAVICNAPHTLKKDERLELRYRVIVHPGRWDAARLRAEYRFTGVEVEKRANIRIP